MDLDLDAYRARIGDPAGAPLSPSAQVLARLHEAHAGAIPFENLDILLGRPILLDLPSLEAKLVRARRGGYCFEQNTLFRAALEALGFRCAGLAARVRVGAPGTVRARTHMVLRVETPDGPFLADVGFGWSGLLHPLPLASGAGAAAAGLRFALRREDAVTWVLAGAPAEGGAPIDLYAFTEDEQVPADYEVASWYCSTHPSSGFRGTLTAQRVSRDGRIMLRDRRLTLAPDLGGGGRETREVATPDALLDVLRSCFGLDFPPGTRFPCPEFPAGRPGGE